MLKNTLLALMSFGLVTNVNASKIKNPDTVVKLVQTDWPTLDPAQCYVFSCGEVLRNVLDTLVGYNGSSPELVSLLAREVPTRANGGISKDGLTYTFKLRKNVRFTDGTPLTAKDVEYSLRRMLVVSSLSGPAQLISEPLLGTANPIDAKENLGAYKAIERAIQATDESTVVLRLAKPFSPLLTILANPYFSIYSRTQAIKAKAWSGTEQDWAKHNKADLSPFRSVQPLGTGPYKLTAYNPVQNLVMERNGQYWRGPAQIKRVVMKVVPEESTHLLMMRRGDADLVDLSPQLMSQLAKDPNVAMTKNFPLLSLNGMFMNQKVIGGKEQLGSGKLDGKGIPTNFFSDIHVRRAFAHSIDRKIIVDQILNGQGIARSALVLSGITPEQPQLGYAFDPKLAKREFEQAFSGKVWQEGFVLPIYTSSDPIRQNIFQLLKRNVEALNPKFHIEIKEMSSSDYIARRARGNLTMWIGNWSLDYADPHNLFLPWTGTGSTYATAQHYSNPKIDKLIHQAVLETVPEKRKALYKQIQQLHTADAFGIPLYQIVDSGLHRSWLKGRHINLSVIGDYFYEMSKR